MKDIQQLKREYFRWHYDMEVIRSTPLVPADIAEWWEESLTHNEVLARKEETGRIESPYRGEPKYVELEHILTAHTKLFKKKMKEELSKQKSEIIKRVEERKKDIYGEVLSATGFPEAVDYGYNQALEDSINIIKEI